MPRTYQRVTRIWLTHHKSNHKASYVEHILLDKHDIDVTKNVQYIDRRIIVHYFVDIKIRIQEITWNKVYIFG